MIHIELFGFPHCEQSEYKPTQQGGRDCLSQIYGQDIKGHRDIVVAVNSNINQQPCYSHKVVYSK